MNVSGENHLARFWMAAVVLMLFLFAFDAVAAEPVPASLESRLAKLESASAPAQTGDNAWMLASTALVLMMTAPGLALFYGGLVRQKNVLATMMHSMFLMGLMSVVWAVFGYGLAFGNGNAFVGNPLQYFLLKGVGTAPNTDYAPTIPHQTFMLFQMMFIVITPALITGAFAERLKFGAFFLFSLLWAIVVYCPLAHMVWGNGGLFNWALGGKIPVLDFAGGTVVHISSGVAALVCAVMTGKRSGFPHEPMPPHNVILSLIGTGLLWVGWFGFNAGSALGAGDLATRAFAATHFSAAAAAMSWSLAEWIFKGKPSVLGTASGMVAGLATITPASGFVTIPSAMIIGFVGGLVCYVSVTKLKSHFAYDDSLDVFGVHGMGSVVGMILGGWFATAEVNPALSSTFKIDGKVVPIVGGLGQVGNQLIGIGFTVVLSGVATFLILKLVKSITGLRVSEEEEYLGLDLTQHGEKAHND